MAHELNDVLNVIQRSLDRLKKISSVWRRKNGLGTNQHIFSVTLGCDNEPVVNYAPSIPAVTDAIFSCPLDKFLDQFEPVLRTGLEMSFEMPS